MDWLSQGDYGTIPTNPAMLGLGLLLSFLCGHVIAWIYMITHSGLSYSRSFVNSLLVMPVIVSLVMMVLSNNIVTAFGLMAVFAIVRFRNILRDTLDTTYVLGVIVIGMACGTYKFSTAAIGCLLTSAIMLYVWWTAFGTRHRFDAILNLHWGRPANQITDLESLLQRHSLRAHCASERSDELSAGIDMSYRILLRDPARLNDLLDELRSLNGVSRVTGLKAEADSEI